MVDLHHNVPIDAAPEKVYAAIATQAGMQGWWTRDTTMDAKVGGKAEFGFDKRAVVFRMTNRWTRSKSQGEDELQR